MDTDTRIIAIAALLAALFSLSSCRMDDLYGFSDGSGSSATSLVDPELNWSAVSCTAILGSDNTFPVLTNEYGVAVTYSSSETTVATISSAGAVTLVAAGTTTITATSEETDAYEASSASYTLTVSDPEDTRSDAGISWSATSFTAKLEESNTFPTITNPNNLNLTYSSTDTGVATVSASGEVALVSAGSTTISATFAGDDNYKPATASYSLTVTSGKDDGAGTYTFSSSGAGSSGDDIANTTFTRKITITYSTSGSASVTGDYYGYATVSGNDVTVNNTGSEYIVYELTGTTTDGFFKLYSGKKQAVLLNDVSITNKNGAAINVQNKKTFVEIQGSNSLADGSSYTDTPSGEDEKAALFCEDDLIFSGSGTLTVTAKGKAGITSDDQVRFAGSPSISVSSSAGHAVRGKDAIYVDSGTINASTSANMKKGFTSDNLVQFDGGTTTIKVTGGTAYDSDEGDYTSSAGVKADSTFYMNAGSLTITNSGAGGKGISVGTSDSGNDCKAYFNGGTVSITTTGKYFSSGDGSAAKGIKVGKKITSGNKTSYTGDMYVTGGKITVNCTGSGSGDTGNEAIESKGVLSVTGGEIHGYSTSDDGINSADDFTISGGYVCGLSTANDGLDSNGNFTIKDGVIMAASASGAEVGIDCAEGKTLSFTGGVLFVKGGLEKGASLSQACYQAASVITNTWYALSVGSTTYAFKTPSSAGTPLVVSGSSTPTLKAGVSVSGGTGIFDGYGNYGGTYSGGTSVSLSSYSAGSGQGGGGGDPGGGPGGNGRM